MARERLTDLVNLEQGKQKPAENVRKRQGTGLYRDGREALVNALGEGGSPITVKSVDPRDCVPFAYNDREFASLTQADIQDLIDGFMDPVIGQLEPCVARQAKPGSKQSFEIIAGTRRLKAALWVVENTSVPFKLQIILHRYTDIEALQAMRGENSYNPPSPYERAISTKRHIEELFAGNLSEYARVMNISKSSLGDLMAFTQLPDICLDAYPSRRSIPIQHALSIRTQLNKHESTPQWKKSLLAKATELSKLQEKAEPAQILSTLLKAANDSLKHKKTAPVKVAVDIGGKKKALSVVVYPDGSLTVQLDSVCRQHPDETLKALQQQLLKK